MGLELSRFVLQTFMRGLGFVKTSPLVKKKGLYLAFGPTMGLELTRNVLQIFVRVLGFVKTSSKKRRVFMEGLGQP